MENPSNADLFALIENQTDAFKAHAEDDHSFQEKTEKRQLAIEDKIDRLATQDDMTKLGDLLILNNRIKIGEAAVKYSIRNAPNFAALFTILFCIFLFIKFGIIGAIAALTGLKL